MKAYLDTNVVSAIAKDDLPAETKALERLLELFDAGKLELVTSKITGTEIEAYKGKDRRIVEGVFRLLKKVPFVEDHKLLGFHSQWDQTGGFSWPLIEDDPTSSALRQMGLDRTDAHQLMLAIHDGCDAFLTCDGEILDRGTQIEGRFSIKPMTPSALAGT